MAEQLLRYCAMGVCWKSFLWNVGKWIHREVQHLKLTGKPPRGSGGVCRLGALEKPCELPLVLSFHHKYTLGLTHWCVNLNFSLLKQLSGYFLPGTVEK